MYKQVFQRLKRAAQHQHVAAFDCEGVGGAGGFVCGSVVSLGETVFFSDRLDMLNYLGSRRFAGYTLFAHNLDYDLALLTAGQLQKFDLLYANARLINAKLRDTFGHVWNFADSRNLFTSFSVEQLGRLLDLPKLVLDHDLKHKITQGTTWSALDLMERAELRAYNVRDSEIVFAAVCWLQSELHALGGQLTETIACCTMDLFRRSYLKTTWDTPDTGTNDWFRESYYGARTEPVEVGMCMDVNGYDFTSLYPAVMATVNFPHPNYLTIDYQPSNLNFIDSKEGMIRCTVDVPDMHLPPLPMRHAKKLFFPTGRLTGTWPLIELRHALSQGVKLLSVDWAMFSRISFNPFAEFINDLFARRLSYQHADDTREKIFKLLLNSAYGRFGIRGDGQLQRLVAIPPGCDWSEFDGCQVVFHDGYPYALMPIGIDQQPAYCCVAIAAQISAAARVRLHQSLMIDAEKVVYTDTDSIFSHASLPLGEGLGELHQEFDRAHVDVQGAKEYTLNLTSGEKHHHVKGIPVDLQAQYLTGDKISFQSPVTILEAIKLGDVPGRWKTRSRKRLETIPKRALLDAGSWWSSYYQTRAWDWEELLQLQAPV